MVKRLANRLINIDRILYDDPRGKVIFFDDFEDLNAITARWQTGDGTSGSNSKSNTYAFEGQYSLKITTGASADDAQSAKYIAGTYNLGSSGSPQRLGFYFKFLIKEALANTKSIDIIIRKYDGSTKKEAKLRWLGTDATAKEKWQYYDSSGSFSDVDDSSYVSSASQEIVDNIAAWHWAKLVVDFENKKYVRLICDDKFFKLEDLSIYSTADTSTKPRLEFEIMLTTETENAISIYIDNSIVTLEEG